MSENEPVDRQSVFLLGAIDAKITHLLNSFALQKEDIKAANAEIHARIDATGARLEKMERAHWKTAGILSLIPITFTIAGLVLAYFNMKG